MTVVSDYRAILAIHDVSARRWNATVDRKIPVFVSYSFLEGKELPSAGSMPYDATSTASFSAAQRNAFRDALAEYEKVAGVRFVETTGDAMIEAHAVTGSQWGGWANYPNVTDYVTSSGSVVLDLTKGDKLSGSGFQIILHEIGHALGLSHPHEGTHTLASSIDTTSTTLMSYSWASTTYASPRPMDIKALQYLYGGRMDVTGWSYGFKKGIFTVAAQAGHDEIFGVQGRNDLSGKRGNDLLIGREGRDSLKGGPGDDVLKGFGGADRLEGGAGDDVLWAAAKGVWDYTANTLIGGPGDDLLKGMKGADRLEGGAGDDVLWAAPQGTGDSSANTLLGGPGDDELWGMGGADRLEGGKGNDVLFAMGYRFATDTRKNTLLGGQGKDQLFGHQGADTLSGGRGADTLDGAGANDTLSGDGGADTLLGRKGDDMLDGGARPDILDGGAGQDQLRGNAGGDRLTGGAGADLFIYRKEASGSRDRITDFELGTDQIDIGETGFNWQDAVLRSTNEGADTILAFTGAAGFSIHFEGVVKSALSAALETDVFA